MHRYQVHFIPNNKVLNDNIIITGNIIMVDYFFTHKYINLDLYTLRPKQPGKH